MTQHYIGRERHLDRLEQHFRRALEGKGQVCFVTGEPGAGKTALVAEFTRRAQAAHENLVVSFGDCNALTGESDPYLPFREIMTLLLGDVEHGVAEGNVTPENAGRLRKLFTITRDALLESGPDIIGIFVPGGALLARLGAKLVHGRGRTVVEQTQVLQQFTNVLRRLAERNPLILILDDLHWGDDASINLLFHLGRRIEGSRILIIGTYRAHEVEEGRGGERHPVARVVNELKRYYGDIQLDLDADAEDERRAFIDELIAREYTGASPSFRDDFFRHTGGHPLFAVELLNELKQRGALAASIDWLRLPARVEGVIAERISHLPESLATLLTHAAVQGEYFSVEVLAASLSLAAADVIRELAKAQDKHRIVRSFGRRREGAARLSVFRFAHNLFQKYLYERINDVQREWLHAAVAEAIEQVSAGSADALQLGDHYARAGNAEKAAHYLRLAGDAAARTYAHAEALTTYSRALQFAEEIGDTSARAALHEAIADTTVLIGHGSEALEHLGRAQALAPDRLGQARLMRKMGRAYADRHTVADAERSFQQADEALQAVEPRDEAWWDEWTQLRLATSWCYYFASNEEGLRALLEESAVHMEQVARPSDRARFLHVGILHALRAERYRLSERTIELTHRFVDAALAGGDAYQHAVAVFQLGFCELWSADRTHAREHLEGAWQLAQRIGAAFPAMLAATYLAVEARMRREVERAEMHAAAAAELAQELNNPTYIANAAATRGWAAYQRGDMAGARMQLESALTMWEAAETSPFLWQAACPLAAIHFHCGDPTTAAAMLTRLVKPSQQRLDDKLTAAIERAGAKPDAKTIGEAMRRCELAALV